MTIIYRSWDFFGGMKSYDFALSSFILQSFCSWLGFEPGHLGFYVNSMHFYERDIVAFQVIEKAGDLTSRVDFVGDFPGVIRPLLKWETHFSSSI